MDRRRGEGTAAVSAPQLVRKSLRDIFGVYGFQRLSSGLATSDQSAPTILAAD
jgi:hypothetical protein